jgi:Rrf2 family protein
LNFQKGTRYALCAGAALARAWSQGPVTVAQVAASHGLPRSVVAKVFQQLVRAGLALGSRGTRGGYRLARPPHTVTVLDVLDAFEPRRPADASRKGDDQAVRRVLDEVDEMARCTFASITLETMVGGRATTGRQDADGAAARGR